MRTFFVAIVAAVAGTLALGGRSPAEDVYYRVPVRELKLAGDPLPATWAAVRTRFSQRWQAMQPYAAVDGEGEAYLSVGHGEIGPESPASVLVDGSLAIRAPKGGRPSGRLFVPKHDWSGMLEIRFALPESPAAADARDSFYQAKQAHYERLLRRGLPGGAWFRHQAREAERERTGRPAESARAGGKQRPGDLARSYELFSGGRAISENLQLDRELEIGQAQGQSVPLSDLVGVTVPEIQWEPLVQGLKPELDPLAASIPADQHAVFFPSFKAALRVGDEAAEYGLPVFRLAEPRAEDARTEERYQRQLCLPTSTLARLLGPHVAKSVALTGSDTYFPTGTDVAVLFEAPQPALLENLLRARIALTAAEDKEAKRVEGRIDRIAYQGFRSPDRRTCTYLARLDHTIVVTNSLVQLERILGAHRGRLASLASLPEYTFFRNRYRRGEAEETAFVMLTDATIRRWCGPRWRIANSRRTRDAAVLADLQAAHRDAVLKGTTSREPLKSALPIAFGGELSLGRAGVVSSTLGTLAFMTPIVELPLTDATPAEAKAYDQWRQQYEREWTRRFDPIAVRLSLGEDRLAAQVTVMPLTGGSEYQSFLNFSGPAIRAESGDRHNALVHLIVGLPAKQLGGPVGKPPTGSCIEVFADDSSAWRELAQKGPEELERLAKGPGFRLPVAFRVGGADSEWRRSIESLVSMFVMSDKSRERRTYRQQAYTKISDAKLQPTHAAYFASLPDGLVLALDEDVLKRAIDRQIDRQAKPEARSPDPVLRTWLETHVGLQVRREALDILSLLGEQEFRHAMQRSSWSNLPVLNEWRRLSPGEDPVQVHRRLWHTEPVCPGGGRYVWNDRWQTMESTAYGHPGEPKQGPPAPAALANLERANFGLSFEDRSLRAAVVLERRPAK